MDQRIPFLEKFLSLFGVKELKQIEVNQNFVTGTAIYDDSDQQDFCWHKKESEIPSDSVVKLIKLLKEKDLVDIDKIIISTKEFYKLSNLEDELEFSRNLDELFSLKVNMEDDGEETDFYFLHD